MPVAKGQKYGDREVKKPRMKKPAAVGHAVSAFRLGSTSPIPLPAKKG
jgi:hypothetical protein